mgnify:CR=1 FL=1|jgi:membrane protease YdiL (CAAX protease family)
MAPAFPLQRLLFLSLVPVAGSLLNGFYNAPLYRIAPALFWGADICLFALAPASIVYWLARTGDIRPSHYGLRIPPFAGFESLVVTVLFAFVLAASYGISKYLVWIFTWQSYVEPEFSYGAITPNGPWRLILTSYWAITAGLTESIFYIGLPWYIWRNRLNLVQRRSLFLWLSATVFALVHWEQGLHNVIGAFVFGLVACLLYWKINDLWPIVGAHTLIDFILFA